MNSENYNTKKVWFYGLNSDGYSLDDNRRKLAENPLPEVVTSYKKCSEEIVDNRKLYFYVPVEEIESNDFDLSYNRYKELEYVAQTFESPQNILNALIELEKEITKEMDDLKDLIG